MSESDAPSAPAAKKKGGMSLILVIVVVAVVAGGAGVGAFWYGRKSAPATVVAAKPVEHGIVSLDAFTVNLADPNAARFLRVTMQLVVPTKEMAEHIQTTPGELMPARSAILELLTTETSEALMTPDGKAALKKSIAEKVTPLLGEAKVLDVLFSDFVIQF
jgi:flagellar FliL protein